MRLRREIAFLLLLMINGSYTESVVGLLRDGDVHHESRAVALAHTPSGAGEHGHEDGGLPKSHQHGKGHSHGTAIDHCTHQHSVALTTAFSFLVAERVTVLGFAERPVHSDELPQTVVHPPRA